MGLFGVGGSSVATPVLALLGAPALAAVASPLPAIIPTLASHWALGHVDWSIAAAFAGGLLPGAVGGGLLAQRLHGPTVRRIFGLFLIAFGLVFTVSRLT
jgi:uncharacterized membrane protein YfcA